MNKILAAIFIFFTKKSIVSNLQNAELMAMHYQDKIADAGEWRQIEADMFLCRTMVKHFCNAKTLTDAIEYRDESRVSTEWLKERINRVTYTKSINQ